MASGWNLWVWLECIGVVQGGSDKLSQLRNNHMTFWYPITFRFRLARACVYTTYRVSISHLD